jgi:hypothetical protein
MTVHLAQFEESTHETPRFQSIRNGAKFIRKLGIGALVVSIIHLALLLGSEATANTYATSFSVAENPISEGGNWINGGVTGLDWKNVITNVGLAYGTQDGIGNFDDSVALLTGAWGPTQTVQATVHSVNPAAAQEEVEVWVRGNIGAHNTTGYEISFKLQKPGGYAQIVRWNGPLGDFTYVNYIASTSGVGNGDVISATVNGNLIIGYVNGLEVIRGTDSTFSSGSPGIGFWQLGAPSNSDFGFTNFTATDGIAPPSTTPTPTPTATATPSATPTSTPAPSATPTPALTPTPTATPPATVDDFNGDGHPDLVLQNASTRQTAIWYLNNNVYIGGAYGPTLAAGWGLRGAADFNGDNHPDHALFALSTRQTAIWYLSGPTLIGGAYGPTLPDGWELVATADFNGDNKSDYVLYNAGTYQTAIWYLNNNVYVGGGYGPTLPPGWSLAGVADFNSDGHTDYVLFHPSSGYTAICYLSGTTLIGAAWGPIVPSGWALVATADFNGDGKPDYLLYNAATGQTAIWYLNNNVYTGSAYGPTLPAGWSLVEP